MSEIDRLGRTRPRNRLLRWTAAALAVLSVYAWISGEIQVGALFESRRKENLLRFLRQEVVPPQVREEGIASLGRWAVPILSERGWTGAGRTLAISTLAIVLAGLAAILLSMSGARTLMAPEAFLPHARRPGPMRRFAWGAVVFATRGVQLFLRSIPEYVWAYLFLAMLGPSAWPAVLALAIHNAGILGKLTSETVENLEPGPLRALRELGARRLTIAGAAVFPVALPRFLLYFFYRFETCVREATVLGMLGIVSLGYWIADARARRFYDEMLLLVLLGAGIVLLGDLVSALARRFVRRA